MPFRCTCPRPKPLAVRGFAGWGYLRSLLALSSDAYNFKQFFLKTRRIYACLRPPEPTEDGRVKSSNIFHDVAKALTSSLDLDSILQTIMEKMAEYFRPDNLVAADGGRGAQDELVFRHRGGRRRRGAERCSA